MSAALHPARRRRAAEGVRPPADEHEPELRPLDGGAVTALIATFSEPSFVDALQGDLGGADWRAALAARSGRRRVGGALVLDQPVHRRFHLFVAEASCRAPGHPRLDPRRIEGMGLVLRQEGSAGPLAWMAGSGGALGWLAPAPFDGDPDPARRPPPAGAGVLGALIAGRRDATARETVVPLFVVPPELCARLGKTIVWGVIPVASAETSPAEAPDYAGMEPGEAAEFHRHFSGYLKARPDMAMPLAGTVVAVPDAPAALAGDGDGDAEADADADRMKALNLFLHQMSVELDAFADAPEAVNLARLLNTIRLPMPAQAEAVGAYDFARAAAAVLIERDPDAASVTMPLRWPKVDDALGGQLIAAATACLVRRALAVAPAAPKFADDAAQYRVRGFIRVRPADGCPPRLAWSDYSEPFRILPWWAGDAPAARIGLPDFKDKALLRSLRPGVTFALPPSLAKLLNADPKQLRDGDGSGSSGVELGWLCSFSIPIITICAFIVLNIFLKLFDLIFQWMLCLKVCIPVPKPKAKP